jgi:acyl carrier protein phosphodiesterase
MLVLEHDRQRDVLRLVMRGRRIRNRDAEAFAPVHLGGRVPDRLSLRCNGAASDQPFQPFARQCRHDCCERAVEAPARLSRLQPNIDRVMAPHAGSIWA